MGTDNDRSAAGQKHQRDYVKSMVPTPLLSVPTEDMAHTAQHIIDDLWNQWYGEYRGKPNVEQMAAILTGTKVGIMHAMLDSLNSNLNN